MQHSDSKNKGKINNSSELTCTLAVLLPHIAPKHTLLPKTCRLAKNSLRVIAEVHEHSSANNKLVSGSQFKGMTCVI